MIKTLQQYFDMPPIEGYVVEYPKDSSIFHIPIIRVKELLSKHFEWSTSNFKIDTILRGNTTIINASVELNLKYRPIPVLDTPEFKRLSPEKQNDVLDGISVMDYEPIRATFVGAYTFNISRYKDNHDWAATALSECIKNSAKNVGRFFGLYLNSGVIEDAYLLEDMPPDDYNIPQKKKPTTKSAVNNIIKEVNKSNNG